MNRNYYDEDYPQTNRDKRMTPRRLSGWCDGCDTMIVNNGSKCPYCGHRQGDRRRLKK